MCLINKKKSQGGLSPHRLIKRIEQSKTSDSSWISDSHQRAWQLLQSANVSFRPDLFWYASLINTYWQNKKRNFILNSEPTLVSQRNLVMNWDVVFAQNINLCALGKKNKKVFSWEMMLIVPGTFSSFRPEKKCFANNYFLWSHYHFATICHWR